MGSAVVPEVNRMAAVISDDAEIGVKSPAPTLRIASKQQSGCQVDGAKTLAAFRGRALNFYRNRVGPLLYASQESAVKLLFHCEKNPPLAACWRFAIVDAEDGRPAYWPPLKIAE